MLIPLPSPVRIWVMHVLAPEVQDGIAPGSWGSPLGPPLIPTEPGLEDEQERLAQEERYGRLFLQAAIEQLELPRTIVVR